MSGLVFDGLHFTGCGTAINLLTANGGTYADITIRNVAITNSYVGLEIVGVEDGLTIRDCSIARTDIGMRVFGQHVHSTGIEISGNVVSGLGTDEIGKLFQTGIFLDRVDGSVHDNVVTGFTKFVIRFGIGIVVRVASTAPSIHLSMHLFSTISLTTTRSASHSEGGRRPMGASSITSSGARVRLASSCVPAPTIGELASMTSGTAESSMSDCMASRPCRCPTRLGPGEIRCISLPPRRTSMPASGIDHRERRLAGVSGAAVA